MGLASANSTASWRTGGGTSGGAEAAMPLSYGYCSRKINQKLKASAESRILLTYAHRKRAV